ncbi:hypothetical protein [Bradyrhizobium sp. Tv2a-2]|uniref:hypothetical protein n=1 Tax=Bradyrhizobium sp. Tv2a-2 TaxID=113395 RepID=UPI000426B1DE|nr:hypothetical protein [Bradyrhizobium sp. Tv2a-2]
MNQKNPEDHVNELTDEQLDKVSAGAPSKASSKPTSSGGLFEVEDYSFDIEQTLGIGSR